MFCMKWKRVMLWVCLLTFVPLAHAEDRPNIVVILADDLGYGDLSSYGGADLKTPAIDKLVSEGMKFTNAYANCPVCSPTRAALLSGRYPDLVGVPGVIRTHADNSWGYLLPSRMLLPKVLHDAGYHTAIVGKWHLGLDSPNTPLERGFDHFHGFLGDMMDDYYKHLRHDVNYMRKGKDAITPEGHATDLFTDWAIEYIRSRATYRAQPFFLYLAYNAPHTPIQPPDEWVAKVKQRQPDITDKRAMLVALIEHMDEGIGRVMKTLEESGFRDKTLVVFTSDNGGQLNVGGTVGPYRGGKGDTYEGGLRVPLTVSWPGKIAAGATSDAVVLSMDVYPTVLEAAGVKDAQERDGVSFVPALRGEPQELTRDLFWMRREGGGQFWGLSCWAMRRGEWKLVKNRPDEPWQLFNLAHDPREENDVSQKNQRQFRELAVAMSRHIQRAGSVPWQQSPQNATSDLKPVPLPIRAP